MSYNHQYLLNKMETNIIKKHLTRFDIKGVASSTASLLNFMTELAHPICPQWRSDLYLDIHQIIELHHQQIGRNGITNGLISTKFTWIVRFNGTHLIKENEENTIVPILKTFNDIIYIAYYDGKELLFTPKGSIAHHQIIKEALQVSED